ncbi:MAG: phage portal protein [Oscillospiraceae bacterium]|nr:phage portal protein [Oscillospiraceae bacterium]MBQ4538248.1 phage portal protein [Oscillospiraceae bacterium]
MPELLKQLLNKTENEHRERTAAIETARRYYRNSGSICRTGAAAVAEVNGYLRKLGKNPLKTADNRISTNWHRIITDQKAGYLCSYPPQIDVVQSAETAKEVNDALGAEWSRVLKRICIEAANCGVGWLTYWYDKGKPFEFWYVPSEQIRAVYDPASIKPKLKYVIRSYSAGKQTRHELWSDSDVVYYVGDMGRIEPDISMGEGGRVEHSYKTPPFIPFYNNQAAAGDLAMYRSIIDAIDKLVSGFANDIDDMQEIIWVIKNYAGEFSQTDYDANGNPVTREIDLLQKLKTRKLVSVEGDGGIETLKSEIPYEARKEFLDILMRQLYISAMAVDPFPQAIGQASGVYIDFLYSLLELKAGMTENEFRPAVNELCRAIMRCKGLEEHDVEQVWVRNKPRDGMEIVDMLSKTPEGVVSKETMTKTHPLTENWQSELKRLEREIYND